MRTQSTKNMTSLPVTWVIQAIADIPGSPVASGGVSPGARQGPLCVCASAWHISALGQGLRWHLQSQVLLHE